METPDRRWCDTDQDRRQAADLRARSGAPMLDPQLEYAELSGIDLRVLARPSAAVEAFADGFGPVRGGVREEDDPLDGEPA